MFIISQLVCQANQISRSEPYIYPSDTLVRNNLDKWEDMKFGIILHWGIYSVPGIVESWSICNEDWIERDSTVSYEEYKKRYFGLSQKFNPTNFEPDKWAEIARNAGMKYLVFTTKHHDGFCMFDTKETDFKITSGPFKNDPRSNVAKHVFDSFRKQGFAIGVYFSKPDWHSEYYWWTKYATVDRNNNYDIRKYPWRWENFKSYTFNQVKELMTEYGKIDILWLDGGWVRPLETVTDEVRSWGMNIPAWSQDIDVPKIAMMARKNQPGILIVDRSVHGNYENYRTPEQHIPPTKLDYPWESCMTLCSNWGYVPGDKPKPAVQVINNLIEIVAKGGNLLLGVGPKPDGTIDHEVADCLESIGLWLRTNGEAIYNTKTVDLFQSNNTFFTRSKNGKVIYAISLGGGKGNTDEITWTGNLPAENTKVKLLKNGQPVKWSVKGNQITIKFPKTVGNLIEFPIAFAYEPAVIK